MALVILVCVSSPLPLSQCGRRVEHLHRLLVHQRLRDCLLYALSIVAQLAAWGGKSINNKQGTHKCPFAERWDTCIINIPHTPCVTANEISFDLFWLSRSHARLSRQQLERTHTHTYIDKPTQILHLSSLLPRPLWRTNYSRELEKNSTSFSWVKAIDGIGR